MATRIVYDYKKMAEKCKEKGLSVCDERLSQYVLYGVPIKKDINNIVDLVLREESVTFAEGFIRAINKVGWGKYIKERINHEETNVAV
jgi:hypothetical protein